MSDKIENQQEFQEENVPGPSVQNCKSSRLVAIIVKLRTKLRDDNEGHFLRRPYCRIERDLIIQL